MNAPDDPSHRNHPSETVSFIVYLPTRPEARERMRKMLFEVVGTMAKEPDFINTWVHEDLNDPDMIVNYETWACSRCPTCRRANAASSF